MNNLPPRFPPPSWPEIYLSDFNGWRVMAEEALSNAQTYPKDRQIYLRAARRRGAFARRALGRYIAARNEFDVLCKAPELPDETNIIDEIAAERRRQIDKEGWTIEHDDQHDKAELALAAAAYATHTALFRDADSKTYKPLVSPAIWPWSPNWWKPKNPRRDLIRAAALIVAEIERLDRCKPDDAS